MNDITRPETNQKPHLACLNLGSNIDPTHNIPRAVDLLRQYTHVESISGSWETVAVGSDGPNFINLAVCVRTELDAAALKDQVITPIEQQLGRVRTADKNAPRTIDLDIILFDGQVLDHNLWRRIFLALPVSELFPNLQHPDTGQTLKQVAERLHEQEFALLRHDLALS